MDQLLYGSADGIEGRASGGWGVIRATPGIEPARRDALAGLASVHLDQTMPQFPSAEQLAGRTRRFRARPAGGEAFACMSVEAGADHTGRPGNVVSHCAAVPVTPDLRAIDWFFSPGWVLPYGAHQVAAAGLPEELVRPAGWPATAHWLRSDPGRARRARWVISAGVEVLQRRQPLVLVADDVADGAAWVSAILWMFVPDIAASYPLLVGEDARSMGELGLRGPYIAVVARTVAVPEWLAPGVVDTTADGAGDGPWGQVVADLLLESDDVARAVFARRDEFLDRYRAQRSREPFRMVDALRAAWLTRDGGHNLGQEHTIRELLAGVGAGVRAWPEFRALAAEVGEGASAPAAGAAADDVYDTLDDAYLPAPDPDPNPAPPEPADVPPVDGALVDRALAAAARLGTLAPFDGDGWLTELASADPARRRDLWLVAGALSTVAPHPDDLAPAVGPAAADPETALAVLLVQERSRLARITESPGGDPWQ